MAKDKKQDRPAQAVQAKPTDVPSQVYAEYAGGRIIDEIAAERGLDSLEVMAMIQSVQAKNREG